ncbi:hypothetical protein BU26DRAFT_571625 [Trematosphaeria pertusa]|uniref:Uncharacterized protein n=1 Tax=Trematosphaeria pertusa TaxID=390896 RepID=A0A6A6HVG7_9PLEO|nr:uncharacterized protein BU26DRAFT_571625 [Trematosphaeria pertusa]KAF2241889.1 hypothetical protein BU26DRAFT_571625 [Trematosphaeria pertusa]
MNTEDPGSTELRLLDAYLCLPNPELRINALSSKAASKRETEWEHVESWTEWTDFNPDEILRKFLNDEVAFADPCQLQRAECSIYSERCLEHVLSKWHNMVVNNALQHICSKLGVDKISWVPGRHGDGVRPDWSGVKEEEDSTSLVPGETKLQNPKSAKPLPKEWPTEESTGEHTDFISFLSQAATYSKMEKSRYAYVITNMELVVMRLSKETSTIPTRPSGTSRRLSAESNQLQGGNMQPPSSSPPAAHDQDDETGEDELPQTQQSIQSEEVPPFSPPHEPPSASDYVPSSSPVAELVHPEIARFAWTASTVTITKALVAIHILAVLQNERREKYDKVTEDYDYRELFVSP